MKLDVSLSAKFKTIVLYTTLSAPIRITACKHYLLVPYNDHIIHAVYQVKLILYKHLSNIVIYFVIVSSLLIFHGNNYGSTRKMEKNNVAKFLFSNLIIFVQKNVTQND